MFKSLAAPRRRINHKMLESLEHRTAERVFREIYKCEESGWNDPPVRYLAAQAKRSIRQTHRALRKLEKLGWIRHTQRWESRTRCATSVYKITGCIVVIDVTEKLPPCLNTKAPRPLSIPAMQKRLRSLEYRNESLEARVRWYERGDQIRYWRSERVQKAHMVSMAQVGRYDGPPLEDDVREMLRVKLGVK